MMPVTPEQIRKITGEVLQRPEFIARPTWTQLLLEHVVKWMRDLAQWSARNPDLSRKVIIVLAILLVLMLGHVIYTVAREFSSLRKSGRAGPRSQPLAALEGVAENWRDAFQLARAALNAGDLYKALWITHRVLLSVLDRSDRIKFVRWKTNTDYLGECRDEGRPAAILSEVTAAYERVIYAHSAFDCTEAAKLLAEVEALAAEAGR